MSSRLRLRQSSPQCEICRSTHWRGRSGRVILPAFHLSVVSSADTSLSRRIDFGPGYRIYFGKGGDVLIICWVVEPRSASNRQ